MDQQYSLVNCNKHKAEINKVQPFCMAPSHDLSGSSGPEGVGHPFLIKVLPHRPTTLLTSISV